MSEAMMSRRPRSSATRAQPIRPPTGPEPIVKIGRSAPSPSGTMPPWHCMMCSSPAKPTSARRLLDAVQVGAGDRADVGVDQGGDEALVLADRLGDLAGDRDEDPGGALGDDLPGAALVGVVADRPEEGDRDRVDPGRDQRVGGRGDRVLVERDDHVAVGVDPLGDAVGRSIGTSGSGLRVSAKRSRFSGGSPVGRPRPRIVRIVSSKPRVVISPIFAPLRSTTMLVATVEPWEISRSMLRVELAAVEPELARRPTRSRRRSPTGRSRRARRAPCRRRRGRPRRSARSR